MHFDDVYDLVDAVVDRFSYEEDKHDKNSDGDMPFVCVVAGYDIMRQVLKVMLEITDFAIGNLELFNAKVDGYDKEYVLTISPDCEVSVERCFVNSVPHPEGDYVYCYNDIVFVHGDVNSRFYIKNKNFAKEIIDFDFEDEEDDCDGCGYCEGCAPLKPFEIEIDTNDLLDILADVLR